LVTFVDASEFGWGLPTGLNEGAAELEPPPPEPPDFFFFFFFLSGW
jgi:hypothetical protein